MPLQLADAGTGENGERSYRTVTQFSMKPIEEIGLLKMDFLGLRNLDVIEDALDIIERSSGKRPDMTTLPLDDAKTYEMLARGDSIGVFQFESEGMREALKKVRPDEFNDLVALNALYRPGAMDQIPVYAKGKRNPETISYPDERLRADPRVLQGRDPLPGAGDADRQGARRLLRRQGRRSAQGDRQEEPPGDGRAEARVRRGLPRLGHEPEVIEFLWQTNEKSADYSFNKSHAACYGLIAYRTAWLKANYPAEYMAALISSVMSTKDKVPFFVARCEEMGIEILPPDVNLSDHEFTVEAPPGRRTVRGTGPRRMGRRARSATSASAWTPSRASATRRWRRSSARARRRAASVHLAVGLLRARRQPHGQQEGDRGAHQVRRARLHRGHAQGDARRARAGPGGRTEGPAGRPDRAGLDLRPRRRGRMDGADAGALGSGSAATGPRRAPA